MTNLIVAAAAAALVLVLLGAFTLRRYVRVGELPAQALAKVEQVPAFRYQVKQRWQSQLPDTPGENSDTQSTVLVSAQYGRKSDANVVDQDTGAATHVEQYLFLEKKRLLTLDRTNKRCTWTDLAGAETRFDAAWNGANLRGILREVCKPKCKRLGRKTIDGIEVEGFQTTDPTIFHVFRGRVDVKLWVDIRTCLPVRIEESVEDTTGGRIQWDAVTSGFQWDVPVAARDFEPVIPADYQTFENSPTAANDDEQATE